MQPAMEGSVPSIDAKYTWNRPIVLGRNVVTGQSKPREERSPVKGWNVVAGVMVIACEHVSKLVLRVDARLVSSI